MEKLFERRANSGKVSSVDMGKLQQQDKYVDRSDASSLREKCLLINKGNMYQV